MTPIPLKMRREMAEMPFYKHCARHNDECNGRITWEHALIVAGKRLNEIWAIVPLCAYHHSVDYHQDGAGLVKELNKWIALCRSTPEDLAKYPRSGFEQMKKYLISKYGLWVDPFAPKVPVVEKPVENLGILWGNRQDSLDAHLLNKVFQ